MESRMLESMRNRVYDSYLDIRNGNSSMPILFPRFRDDLEHVWWKGDIIIPFVDNSNYFVGEIKDIREFEGRERIYTGIVADSSEGVRAYENYFGTLFRPALTISDGSILIIDVNEIENNSEKPKRFDGFSTKELIEINLNAFPKQMELKYGVSGRNVNQEYFVKHVKELEGKPILF